MNSNLSVNLNKIALLRNSRLINKPSLADFANFAINAGALGLTVHPRADSRHITLDDVLMLSKIEQIASGKVELNIEGDIRPELIRVIDYIKPTQFTVVPTVPGELTSERGWRAYDDLLELKEIVTRFRGIVRVSVFVDPDPESVDFACEANCDAVEIYTGTYAKYYGSSIGENELRDIILAAERARSKGLRVHCGHDLNLENLITIASAIRPEELSIGHALMSDALIYGFETAVRKYIEIISKATI